MGVCSETKPTLLAGYIITIVAFVIHLIGFATPYWNFAEKTTKISTISITSKKYFGLWKYCVSISSTIVSSSKCVSIGDVFKLDSEFKGTQAVECFTFILFVAAVVCLTMRVAAMKDKDVLILVAMGLCIAAGVFALIGVFNFGVNKKYNDNIHFSFAFCVIGGVGGIIAGVVLVGDKLKSQFNL